MMGNKLTPIIFYIVGSLLFLIGGIIHAWQIHRGIG